MSYTDLLIDTCDVTRFSEGAQDAYGIPAKTWAVNMDDLACRLVTQEGFELKRGDDL